MLCVTLNTSFTSDYVKFKVIWTNIAIMFQLCPGKMMHYIILISCGPVLWFQLHTIIWRQALLERMSQISFKVQELCLALFLLHSRNVCSSWCGNVCSSWCGNHWLWSKWVRTFFISTDSFRFFLSHTKWNPGLYLFLKLWKLSWQFLASKVMCIDCFHSL